MSPFRWYFICIVLGLLTGGLVNTSIHVTHLEKKVDILEASIKLMAK